MESKFPPGVQTKIYEIVHPYMVKKKHSIVSIGIIKGSNLSSCGFGDIGGYDVDSYTELIFEIGSVSKVFTTTLLAYMIQYGLVSLNDSIGKYIETLPSDFPITLEHLATHSSGLPSYTISKEIMNYFDRKVERDPYCLYSMEEAIDYLNQRAGKKKGKFRYSNAGMGLLGHILAEKLETDFETAIRNVISSPYDMQDTFITLGAEPLGRIVQGYAGKDKSQKPLRMKQFSGAGALRSTVNDLLKFLSKHMESHFDLGGKEALSLMQAPRLSITKGVDVGLGWMIDSHTNSIFHNGATQGFSSFVGFKRSKPVGVVVLSNYRTGVFSDSPERIGQDILNLLIDEM